MLRNEKGFTLFEMVLVVALVAIIIGAVAPSFIRHLEESKVTGAKMDISGIKKTIERFYEDNALYPRSDGSDDKNQSLTVMFFGPFANLPKDTAGNDWGIEAIKVEPAPAKRNLFLNHLLKNDPNNSGTYGSTGDYPISGGKRWRGPYLSSPEEKADPWGNAYMVSFCDTQDGVKGKVVSAGPDSKLKTKPCDFTVDPVAGSDDIVSYF